MYLDAEKAFNSISHNGLKKMLLDSKIPISIVRWLSSYLDNRTGCIKINSNLSREFLLRASVPQGSLLAPLLYIFYIKDMPTKILSSLVSSFNADDTSYAASDTLHKSSKLFLANQLQRILTDLEDFFSKWRVGLNSEKTWCLNFFQDSKNKNTPRLWLKGELLKYKTECKFLGFHFDQKLTFKTHIETLVSRCKKG